MRLATFLCVVATIFAACGDDPVPQQEDGATTLEGVVIDVQSGGLNQVTSFTLRHDDEETDIYIIEDHDYGFPLGHLNEHLSSGGSVIVTGETRDGRVYADSIEDA